MQQEFKPYVFPYHGEDRLVHLVYMTLSEHHTADDLRRWQRPLCLEGRAAVLTCTPCSRGSPVTCISCFVKGVGYALGP